MDGESIVSGISSSGRLAAKLRTVSLPALIPVRNLDTIRVITSVLFAHRASAYA